MDLGLADKVVLITGASRGIGRASALAFAAQGARLVLNHLQDAAAMESVVQACRDLGVQVECLQADVSQPDTPARLVGLALERYGRIDVLINNAARVVENLLATVEEDELQVQVQTNVLGLVRMSRAVLRPMLLQRSGCILNLSSALATRPARGNSVYAGTKGFVEAFTRALAVEVGRRGIRVNAVAPGVIATDMTAGVRALAAETIPDRIALKRVGTPEEVASVLVFLASPAASYLHAAIVPIDGGFTGGV
jgi:3-oxoacyl-[acyl-carrier protein] reductase